MMAAPYQEWYEQALLYVATYKLERLARQKKQMRDVPLYCMHAIVVASWKTHFPLVWHHMSPLLARYKDDRSKLQWKTSMTPAYQQQVQQALAEGRAPPPQPVWEKPPTSTARTSTRTVEALEFSVALQIVGDWAALTHKHAMHFLKDMQIEVCVVKFESQVAEEVCKCVKLYRRHAQRHMQKHGKEVDEVRAQLQAWAHALHVSLQFRRGSNHLRATRAAERALPRAGGAASGRLSGTHAAEGGPLQDSQAQVSLQLQRVRQDQSLSICAGGRHHGG